MKSKWQEIDPLPEELNVPLAKRDKIHLNLDKQLGYNKTDNFVITTRGMGKSTIMWDLVYSQYRKGYCPIIQKVRPVELTQTFFDDIPTQLNLFRKPNDYCQIQRRPGGNKSDGMVDLLIYENGEEHVFCRVIPISIEVRRFKSMCLPNVGDIFVDEFLPDVAHGEKWLEGYTWRADTLFSTFARYAMQVSHRRLRRFWFGNPYSRYIPPLFEDYNVDTLDLNPGAFLVGENYTINLATPSDELQELLKKENPLLLNTINKEWTEFMNGAFFIDNNYEIMKDHPKGFGLRWVFRFCNTYIGIYREHIEDKSWNADVSTEDGKGYHYWVGILPRDYMSARKDIYCFDFNDFVKGSKMVLQQDKAKLGILKYAIAYRKVAFESVNAASIMEQIYANI